MLLRGTQREEASSPSSSSASRSLKNTSHPASQSPSQPANSTTGGRAGSGETHGKKKRLGHRVSAVLEVLDLGRRAGRERRAVWVLMWEESEKTLLLLFLGGVIEGERGERRGGRGAVRQPVNGKCARERLVFFYSQSSSSKLAGRATSLFLWAGNFFPSLLPE